MKLAHDQYVELLKYTAYLSVIFFLAVLCN